ncbi:MAG: Ribbon-helix-helix protein, copG family, putative antitoxin [Candidatus Methanohalarchaeum thermophilum]|uniref:Ribbon-helix-helix protein, copG family, putative antitoxin n=1 Tax=Methanohalarchaeum thermophilum TaxID=1903181 RepID=A0A1Q6DWT0_METT1|nr:MAG: Ribbon-helix-helix protein, copG family, putative antitoxin [Candidatus Methanohalarchaeum thermophilum]
MSKKTTTVHIDEELHQWAKEYGLNLSKFVENQFSEARTKLNSSSNQKTNLINYAGDGITTPIY